MPALIEDISARSPEAAQSLRNLFPELPATAPTAGQLNEQPQKT